ncbi:MAG: hypothetical protein QOC98_571 [Frankiaceae bacterium]|nr:hypothetical protein [Frankiaceae bacterium]
MSGTIKGMAPRSRPFAQVDVFSAEPYRGNPVAVVLDGSGLTAEQMQRLAAWTNLSETTFVLPPRSTEADYGVRIFTPSGELPFAGHPTLGTAHAWLESGGVPASDARVVQECEIGLVEMHRDDSRLSFRAPELLRSGELDPATLDQVAKALRLPVGAIVASQLVDNGPGWVAVQVASADEVLALEPDHALLAELMVGVVGAYPAGSQHAFEVRGFAGRMGVPEDPVTGSLNAGLGQWLIASGRAPASYEVSQGTQVGRRGVVSITSRDGGVWVGGDCVTCIRGSVLI